MATTWFVRVKGNEHGPFSPTQLEQLAQTGKITPRTEVKRGVDGAWVPANRVKGLFPDPAETVDQPPGGDRRRGPSQPPHHSREENRRERATKAENAFVDAAVVEPASQPHKRCQFCGEEVLVSAVKCKHCGEWLRADAGPPTGSPFAPGVSLQPRPIKIVHPALVVLLLLVTLGFYHLFWLYRVYSELHSRGATSTTPGKAVGFLFIPFFNIVWLFMVWKELGDAVSREYRKAGCQPPITATVWLLPSVRVLAFIIDALLFPLGSVIDLIVAPTVVALAQSWMNQLAQLKLTTDAQHAGLPLPAPTGKKCPNCAERVKIDARVCRFCGHDFTDEENLAAQQEQREREAATAVARARARQIQVAQSITIRTIVGWVCAALCGAVVILAVLCAVAASLDTSSPYYKDGELDVVSLTIGFVCCSLLFCGPLGAVSTWMFISARKMKQQPDQQQPPATPPQPT